MAAKKDLHGAITTGIDRLFSANDAQEVHRADEVTEAQLDADVREMQALTEAAEARRTQGRKGYKMQRLNISLTPSEYEYLQIMAGVTGKSLTRFIADLIDKDAAANEETYKKAKELISNARQ